MFPILLLSYLPFISAVIYAYCLIWLYFVCIIVLLSTLYRNFAWKAQYEYNKFKLERCFSYLASLNWYKWVTTVPFCKPGICWKIMSPYVATLCLFIYSFQFDVMTMPSSRRSATPLKPATADVNNVDLLAKMQRHAGKLLAQAFMWMPLDTHTTHPNTILDRVCPLMAAAAPDGSGIATNMTGKCPDVWWTNKKQKIDCTLGFSSLLVHAMGLLTNYIIYWLDLPPLHVLGLNPHPQFVMVMIMLQCFPVCLHVFSVSASHPPLASGHGHQPTVNPSSTCILSALASLAPSRNFNWSSSCFVFVGQVLKECFPRASRSPHLPAYLPARPPSHHISSSAALRHLLSTSISGILINIPTASSPPHVCVCIWVHIAGLWHSLQHSFCV